MYKVNTSNASMELVCSLGEGHYASGAASVYDFESTSALHMPNVFTPNGDGLNEVFTAPPSAQLLSLQVYNRWGQLLYEGHGAEAGWTGRTFDGQAAQEGTYYYVAGLAGCDTGRFVKGVVSLLR